MNTPHEITQTKQFLTTQEAKISAGVSGIQTKEIVSLVFQILQKELDSKFEQADKEMAVANGQG